MISTFHPILVFLVPRNRCDFGIAGTNVLLRLNNGFVRGFVEKSWPGNRTCCSSTVDCCWCVLLLCIASRTLEFGSLSMQRPGLNIEPRLQSIPTPGHQIVHNSLG